MYVCQLLAVDATLYLQLHLEESIHTTTIHPYPMRPRLSFHYSKRNDEDRRGKGREGLASERRKVEGVWVETRARLLR